MNLKKYSNILILAALYTVLLSVIQNATIAYIYFALLFTIELFYLVKKQYDKVIFQIILLIPLMGITAVDGVSLANIYSSIFALYIMLFERKYAHSRKALLLYFCFVTFDLIKFFIYSGAMTGASGVISAFAFYLSVYSAIVSYEYIAKNTNKMVFSSSFIVGTFLSILYGFITRFISGGLVFAFTNSDILTRNSGASGDPNYFGLYICISIAFLLIQVVSNKTAVNKYIAMVFFGFMGMSSSSRMYYILMILLVFVVLLQVLKQAFSKNFVKVLFVIVFSLMLGFAFKESIDSNLEYIMYRTTSESDITNGRGDLIERYGNYMNSDDAKSVFGIGVPNYNVRASITISDYSVAYAHNLFIELYVTQGIVGIILIVCMILFWLLKNIKNIYFLGTIPFLVFLIGGFGVNYVEVDSFYILFALALCFMKKEELCCKEMARSA